MGDDSMLDWFLNEIEQSRRVVIAACIREHYIAREPHSMPAPDTFGTLAPVLYGDRWVIVDTKHMRLQPNGDLHCQIGNDGSMVILESGRGL